MSEWKSVKLGEVCEMINERVNVTSLSEDTYISTENMLPERGGVTISSALPTIPTTQKFKIGDILVSNIRPYFKKIWFATFDGGCSNDVLVFRAKKNVDNVFLYYVLSNDSFFDYSTLTSKGTKMPRGDKQAINKYPLSLPPLPTQQKIAKILSAFDQKIEINNLINKTLENIAKAVWKREFGNIRDGSSKIGNYITPQRGRNLLSKDAVSGCVPVVAGGLEPVTYHNMANTKAPVITISASGANAGFVKLWGTDVWSSDSSFIDSKMTKNIYFWYVHLKERQREIFDAQTGSAQPHIYPKHIADLSMTEIDEGKIKKFSIKVEPLFKQIAINTQENTYLSSLRDTLLPKLLNNQIKL